jgi:predicted metal-dependent hydrolase
MHIHLTTLLQVDSPIMQIEPNFIIHPEAEQGIRLFDSRHYFEAHEALETAWREELLPIRNLYRGILQVAVAYYHIQRGNYVGARKLFNRSRKWLDLFPGEIAGIDLDQFRRDFTQVENNLIRLGPDRAAEVDPGLMKPLPRVTAKR